MKAFVQVKPDGEFDTENQYSAWRALNLFGYEVVKFNNNQVDSIKVTKETPCVGGLGTMRRIFKKLGVFPKDIESYPESLKKFLGRKVENTTVKEAILQKKELFIKPTDEFRKSFNGQILNPKKLSYSLGTIYANDPEHPVIISDLVNFISEYRVCILNGKILDARPYKGDASLGFNKNTVLKMIEAYSEAPIAYCLDVGKDEYYQTKLVEVTDAWSFGHYGLEVSLYGKMLVARWEQIVNSV